MIYLFAYRPTMKMTLPIELQQSAAQTTTSLYCSIQSVFLQSLKYINRFHQDSWDSQVVPTGNSGWTKAQWPWEVKCLLGLALECQLWLLFIYVSLKRLGNDISRCRGCTIQFSQQLFRSATGSQSVNRMLSIRTMTKYSWGNCSLHVYTVMCQHIISHSFDLSRNTDVKMSPCVWTQPLFMFVLTSVIFLQQHVRSVKHLLLGLCSRDHGQQMMADILIKLGRNHRWERLVMYESSHHFIHRGKCTVKMRKHHGEETKELWGNLVMTKSFTSYEWNQLLGLTLSLMCGDPNNSRFCTI